MLGGLFKKKDDGVREIRDITDDLYACALQNTRDPVFYEEYGVPDSFDGRFDLLLVHIFIILNLLMPRDDYEDISQSLFDSVFKDMDQTLREMGIGDMGVPKHMKRMMKAFNGRMHSYQWAVDPDSMEGREVEGLQKTSLAQTLERNLYATLRENEDWDKDVVKKMEAFIVDNIKDKNPKRIEDISNGLMVYKK